jgi:hypothetical protein
MIALSSIKRIVSRVEHETRMEQNLNTTPWGNRRKPYIERAISYLEVVELTDGTIIGRIVPARVW